MIVVRIQYHCGLSLLLCLLIIAHNVAMYVHPVQAWVRTEIIASASGGQKTGGNTAAPLSNEGQSSIYSCLTYN